MLAAFAAGTLDHGQHVAIATHLVSCPQCRAFMRSMEQVGGAVLTSLPPAAMSSDALAQVEARLDEPRPRPPPAPQPPTVSETEMPGLPQFVRRYSSEIGSGSRRRCMCGQSCCRSQRYAGVSARSGPGTRMLQHTHTGIEMTCVLSGAFSQDGGRFGPGDFDLGDDTIDHQPVVDAGEDCICLVAMQGELRLKGLIGRMVQPFVRL